MHEHIFLFPFITYNSKIMITKLKNIKKRYWIIGLIVTVLILFFVLRNTGEKNIVTYDVQRQEVSDAITLAGTIDVQDRVTLGFATPGRISQIFYKEGETVKKGQVIAQIDQNQLQAGLVQAQASQVITEANTQSDTNTASVDFQNIKAQQDKLVQGAYQNYLSGDLQAYFVGTSNRELISPIVSGTYSGAQEGEYVLDLYSSSARSGYSLRLSGFENGTYEAQENIPGKLGERGLYIQFDPNTNYGNTQWVVPVPNTRSSSYLARKTAYENALATQEQVVASAQNNLNRVNATTGNTSRTQAQLQQARAQVSAVSAQLNDGKITAPFDGIVARNNLEIGEIVSAYEALITLFGSDERELQLNVPEIYINKLETEDTVEVTLDAYPNETFTGTVNSIDIIDTIVDGVPVYQTVVTINQQDPRIRVGMNAKGRVTSDSRSDVLAIPQHYLIERDGTSKVLLRKDNETVEVVVGVGFKGNDGMVEIISGLNENDRIVRPDGFDNMNN